jgi:hypothetical protein
LKHTRLTRRPLLVGAALLVTLAVAALVVLRFAPDRLLREVFGGAVAAPPEDLNERLQAHHQGPSPCLRWEWLSTRGAPEGVEEAAVALRALGLGSSEWATWRGCSWPG